MKIASVLEKFIGVLIALAIAILMFQVFMGISVIAHSLACMNNGYIRADIDGFDWKNLEFVFRCTNNVNYTFSTDGRIRFDN